MGNDQSNTEVQPQVGDIIRFRRDLPYDHFGVYAGNGNVIHRAGNPNKNDNAKAEIRIDSLRDAAGSNEKAELANYLDKKHTPLPPNEIVDRLGEKGYSLGSKNCEHFATWCRYGDGIGTEKGEGFSEQVNRFAYLGTGITEDNPEYVLDQLPERGPNVALQ